MKNDNKRNNNRFGRAVTLGIRATILFAMAVIPTLLGARVANATDPCAATKGDFLGFPAWNRGVCFKPDSQVGPEVLKIVLNVIDMLMRLAGIVAVIVIIYAGVLFIICGYAPSAPNAVKAKTTLINGVIGLAIAIAATAIVTFVVGSLK